MRKYRIKTVAEILGLGSRRIADITKLLKCRLPGELRTCPCCHHKRHILKPIYIDEESLRRVAAKCGRLDRVEKLERDGLLAGMGTEITSEDGP